MTATWRNVSLDEIIRNVKKEFPVEDECDVEESLYNSNYRQFSETPIETRIDDFYESQKKENEELEKLLNEVL